MGAKQSIIISIEGNIGSGKSTLLANLKEHYGYDKNVVFIKEPVDEWETIRDVNDLSMLQKFYADQEKYAFPFQMMAYISRLALLKETLRENPDTIIITERSLYTDKYVFAKMLFDSGKIEDVNYQIYEKWFATFASDFPISKIIYVKADPVICSERIMKRSRTGESNIPIEYLTQCDEYHNQMMETISTQKMTLDGNVDIFENQNMLSEWLLQITEFIEE